MTVRRRLAIAFPDLGLLACGHCCTCLDNDNTPAALRPYRYAYWHQHCMLRLLSVHQHDHEARLTEPRRGSGALYATPCQVAVHNVPFKWCNDDLEELFREQEGYLDAQLLFHENGRSKVRRGHANTMAMEVVNVCASVSCRVSCVKPKD